MVGVKSASVPPYLLMGPLDWPWQLSGPRAPLTVLIFSRRPLNRHGRISCLKILEMQRDRWLQRGPPPISGILIGRVWPGLSELKEFSERNRIREALRPAERRTNHFSKWVFTPWMGEIRSYCSNVGRIGWHLAWALQNNTGQLRHCRPLARIGLHF